MLNSYLLGGEKRAFGLEKEDSKKQDLMVKSIVVSVEGKTEDVIAEMDKMHGKDYDFVLLEITKVLNDSSYEEKKTD